MTRTSTPETRVQTTPSAAKAPLSLRRFVILPNPLMASGARAGKVTGRAVGALESCLLHVRGWAKA